MRRRQLIRCAAAAAILALPGGRAHARAWLGADPVPRQARRLLRAVRRPHSAAAVGRAYLAQRPQEADPERLVEHLTRTLACHGCDPGTSPRTALRAAVAHAVREDFAHGRTVGVQGWVLSATEARLCGLAALAAA